MSTLAAQGQDHGADSKDALVLLEQALEILDSKKVSPDVGARLQEVIDKLKALGTA